MNRYSLFPPSTYLSNSYPLQFLMNSMIKIPHRPHKDLRTLQHPLLTVPPSIQAHKRSMRIIKLRILNRLPNIVHLIRRKRNLKNPLASPRRTARRQEQTILGYDHINVNDAVPAGRST